MPIDDLTRLDASRAGRYSKSMGFSMRVHRFVGLVVFAQGVVGCGQVTEPRGGEGALADGSAEEASAPSATERFAFAKSGTRLKALGYLSEDVAQFRTLHDQLLGFDCEFVTGSDGQDFLCVPKDTTSLIFLDAACSQPAMWVSDRRVEPGQWLSSGRTSNDLPGLVPPKRDVFEVAEEIYGESTLPNGMQVYERQGVTCVLAWSQLPDGGGFPGGKPLPAINRLIAHPDSELVSAKSVSADAGGGLRLSRLIGADGSELTLAVTNADGEACTVQPSGECAPPDKRSGPFPATQRIRQGSGSTHVDLFTSSPGLGSPGVPVAHYPEALDFLVDDDERCQVTKAVDGTLRCARLSFGAYGSSRWSDAACTQRLYYGDLPGEDAARMRAPILAEDGSLAALMTVKVYDGPLYEKDFEACTPAVDWGGSLLQLDQRTDATTLPLVVETTL